MAGTACAAPWCAECYRKWQEVEALREAAEQAARNRRRIEQDDPEIESVVEALEEGWIAGTRD